MRLREGGGGARRRRRSHRLMCAAHRRAASRPQTSSAWRAPSARWRRCACRCLPAQELRCEAPALTPCPVRPVRPFRPAVLCGGSRHGQRVQRHLRAPLSRRGCGRPRRLCARARRVDRQLSQHLHAGGLHQVPGLAAQRQGGRCASRHPRRPSQGIRGASLRGKPPFPSRAGALNPRPRPCGRWTRRGTWRSSPSTSTAAWRRW